MGRTTYILCTVLYVFLSLLHVVEMSELVSLNKPTAQSSTYRNHYSSNAVDGNKDQSLGKNSCVHQAHSQPEVWWRVDLLNPVNIEKVEIYYREENYNWAQWKSRFAGYEVYLSNTTERRREDRCFKDQSKNMSQIQSFVSDKECNGTAQYVIIYNHRETPKRRGWFDKNALLELCEVQVYGCDEGTYGNGNCDQKCSSKCPGSLCNPNSGICLYRGDTTNTRPGSTDCRPCSRSCAGLCDDSGCCKDEHDTAGMAKEPTTDEDDTTRMAKEPITTPILAAVVGLLAILLMVSVIIIIKMRMKRTAPSGDQNHQDDAYNDLNAMDLQPPNIYEGLEDASNSQGRNHQLQDDAYNDLNTMELQSPSIYEGLGDASNSQGRNHQLQDDAYNDLNTMELQPPNIYEGLGDASNSQGSK